MRYATSWFQEEFFMLLQMLDNNFSGELDIFAEDYSCTKMLRLACSSKDCGLILVRQIQKEVIIEERGWDNL